MRKFIFSTIVFFSLCNIKVTAQMVTDVDDFTAGPGNKFSWALTDTAAKTSITAPGGVFLAQAKYEASAIIQRWISSDCVYGFDIKNNPFCKFDAKASRDYAMPLVFVFCWNEGGEGNITYTLNLTTSMTSYVVDLATLIKDVEAANKKTIKLMRFIQFQFPWKYWGSKDSFAFYLDNWKLGEAANPCNVLKPTLSIPSSATLYFNQKAAANGYLFNISDGNDGKKTPISIKATSSDSTIIPNPKLEYHTPDNTGTLKIAGANPPKSGTVLITVTVSDTAYCNNKITKSFFATVKPEVLSFSVPAPNFALEAIANSQPQVFKIMNITNISRTDSFFLLPDNYNGITLTAKVNTGSVYLSEFTKDLSIDPFTGTAEFGYTPVSEGTAKVQFTMKSLLTGNTKDLYLIIQIAKDSAVAANLEASNANLEVFPNPATDIVHIALPEGAESLRLIDVTGSVVKSISTEGQDGTIAVDVSELARGTYIVAAKEARAILIVK